MDNIYWFISEEYMAVFILYKNNGSHSTESGGEEPWRRFWTFYNCNYDLRWLPDDSSEDPEHFMRLCDRSHCATSPNVPCGQVLNLELLHLVNEIQTQPLWLKPISTTEWLKLCHFWMYFCQITWNISSRCIVRCPRILNNIIKAKGVCKTTFGKKIRISWVCCT